MGYAYSNNGLSFRAWYNSSTITTGEVYFDHVPTTAELTAAFSGYTAAVKAEKISDLNAEYEAKFQSLQLQYCGAYLNDGTTVSTKQEALATQYQVLTAEKKTKRSAILNG